MEFSDPIGQIKGIGNSRNGLLTQAGITTVGDLLSYLPYAYEDSSRILTINEAREEVSKSPLWELSRLRITVRATLEKVNLIRTRRGLFLVTASFSDSSSDRKIKAVWFNQPYKQQELHEGKEYILFGKVQRDGQTFIYQSPKFEEVEPGKELEKLGGVAPVYRRIKSATSTYLRKYIATALSQTRINEYIPEEILRRQKLPELPTAFGFVHAPASIDVVRVGHKRLAIQELIEIRRSYEAKFQSKPTFLDGETIAKEFARLFGHWIPTLPFVLTKGQEEILEQILSTIQERSYLDALTYGDVGSGKTIIALLLAFAFASIGKASVFAAPTTILALQHVKTARKLQDLFGVTNIKVIEMYGGKGKKLEIKPGDVVIGTQSVLHNESIQTDPDVAFVCIDEQHRFGVEQRTQLKANNRHILTLSATPIPRTLALSFLGFSSAYFLKERPVGRKEIITKVVPFDKEQITYEWLVKHLSIGEQVYIVFPRIVSEEETERQSLLAMADELKKTYFSNFPSALLHGGLKEEEKSQIMTNFAEGKIKLLFSTSVIEVGVDVPNATIIAIHGAEYFGMAQLHQLRGRVGRSSQQGYCFLFPSNDTIPAKERLEFFADHTDGLEVSEYDLKNRGTGTLLGIEQSGLSELRIADVTDLSTVSQAMSIYTELSEQKVEIIRYFR